MRRPAVVVSANWFNDTRAELHLVVPITSRTRPIGTHYLLRAPAGGLDVDSDAMCEHLRSVSTQRFVRNRGELEREHMDELIKRIRVLTFEPPSPPQRA
jgi:mRNA-degrading endonuclease toxin of MazEF toxin-antitoxin module